MKREKPTPVLFRRDKPGTHSDEVTAVFPTLPGSPRMMTCYAHIGQHGSCSPEWLRNDTVPATPEEYAPLKRELESIGYMLRVVHRVSRQMDQTRHAAERAPYVAATFENRAEKRD